nr:StlD/DarB family beta-ketosynthase [Ramlibacter tataouinensis]
MIKPYHSVYITGTGKFMPNAPVTNDQIDQFIEPLNARSPRIKNKILEEAGIKTRHYALDQDARTTHSCAQMGAQAIRDCLDKAQGALSDLAFLCSGTSGGDTVLPGFANAVQGELGAQPLVTSSHQGVCASGMAALQHGAMLVERGEHACGMVVAAEFPSRLFKKSRFTSREYNTDFDSHFLRWMLSDGAGAFRLASRPATHGLSLKLHWLHLKSFSGDYPLCMQVGFPEKNRPQSYLDYPSFADAEKDGAFLLRQDIRLLPHLFDVGIHEYAKLVRDGVFRPEEIDHFLCHYSSEKLGGVVGDLMDKSGLVIPRERWYSNLAVRGNTGAASIFVMLDDFLASGRLRNGQKILLFVPESGRFTVSYALLEAVESGDPAAQASGRHAGTPPQPALPEAPVMAAAGMATALSDTLKRLAGVWQDYRSAAWRTPLIRKLVEGRFAAADYRTWMEHWVPQVREGSRWMFEAVDSIGEPFLLLKALIRQHGNEEKNDFKVLYEDYLRAGGDKPLDALVRNPGGEALNAYMHAAAARPNPVALLGGIYIIEGTGQRIIPALLPMIREQTGLPPQAYRFLQYHGDNDPHHLERWLAAVEIALDGAEDPQAMSDAIVRTAREVASLYLLHMDHVQ